MKYAGIGSRTTPPEILAKMKSYATRLEKLGYILRSGGAEGADTAFTMGCALVKQQIFRPKHSTPAAEAVAEKVHPGWHNCNDYVRKLHGRNAQIILGKDLNDPVEFVVCWTPTALVSGGTRIGVMIAIQNDIRVFNLADDSMLNDFEKFILQLEEKIVQSANCKTEESCEKNLTSSEQVVTSNEQRNDQ